MLMKQPNVNVFVSHRIDLNSVVIKNDVYKPVRCGACFDPDYSGELIGDNTGENISELRMKVGEFTVQYWAWKNVEADYYGICHYRRYLSFSDEKFDTDEKMQVVEKHLNRKEIKKYRLDDPDYIREYVSQYDAVVSEYADISKMFTPKGPQPTIYEHFSAYDGYLVNKEDVDLFLDTLEDLYPDIGKCAREYFVGKKFRGFNCFILKRDLFNQLCEIETSVLDAIHKSGKIDFKYRTNIQSRTYGFFTEWIYGSYLYYLEKHTDKKIKSRQLVYFENTEIPEFFAPVEDAVPVVFLINRYLSPVAMTAINSLISSKKEATKYDVILLHEDLMPEDQRFIEDTYKNNDNISIRFINYRKSLPPASNDEQWNKTHNIASAALFLPWLLPRYERAIYLHTDIIAKTDLSELFNRDLEGNLIAAPIDYERSAEVNANKDIYNIRKYKIGLADPYMFVNTSVIVFDLQKWRDEVPYDLVMRYALGSWLMRDVMNRICRSQVSYLDAAWNVVPVVNADIKMMRDYIPKVFSDDWKRAEKEPQLIHYQYYPKPWHTMWRQNTREFWETARSTCQYELLLEYCRPGAPAVVNREPLHWRVINKLLPYGSRRRAAIKAMIPRGSFAWKLLRKIKNIFS